MPMARVEGTKAAHTFPSQLSRSGLKELEVPVTLSNQQHAVKTPSNSLELFRSLDQLCEVMITVHRSSNERRLSQVLHELCSFEAGWPLIANKG